MATKALLEQGLIEGTVVLFGTPAEETTSGKIDLVHQHEIQNRVDCCMMLYDKDQRDENRTFDRSSMLL